MSRDSLLSSIARDSQNGTQRALANGRWRWWYESIADWMLRHPDKPLKDCARDLGKHPNTISMIVSSDMFKDYYAQRRQQWIEAHDDALRSRLCGVAEKSLDALLSQLEKKGDQVPLPVAAKIAESALDRLGFAPQSQAPAPQNVINQDNRTVVLQGVTASALEEAREALRRVERTRSEASMYAQIDHQTPKEPDSASDPI